METIELILGLIGSLITGGFAQWWWTAWRNRKTDSRKEEATADSMEDENHRQQIDWLEKRITERDAKVDAVYRELRTEQSDKLGWMLKCHQLELHLKDSEYNRCNMPDSECGRRIPPRELLLKQMKEETK